MVSWYVAVKRKLSWFAKQLVQRNRARAVFFSSLILRDFCVLSNRLLCVRYIYHQYSVQQRLAHAISLFHVKATWKVFISADVDVVAIIF